MFNAIDCITLVKQADNAFTLEHFSFCGLYMTKSAEWQIMFWSEAPQNNYGMILQALNVNIMVWSISRTWAAIMLLLRD